MAGALGPSGPDLTPPAAGDEAPPVAALPSDLARIPFYPLVHLLLGARDQAAPGGTGPPSREALRFRAAASLAFAPGDVAEVEEIEERPDPWEPPRKLHRITVNFLGLYGPSSPLPNHVTEEILQGGAEAAAVRDFLDLFNHRLISFVYRGWERVRPYLRHEPDLPDDWTRRFLAFLGLGTEGASAAMPVDPARLLRTAGLFASLHRSAAGLESLLRDLLPGIPVTVDSCVHREVRMPPEAQSCLGRRGRLGDDARIGEILHDGAGAFRVVLGPLTLEQYRALLPEGETLALVVAAVRFYAPDALVFTLRLRLPAEKTVPLRLQPSAGLPLGRLSWLGSPREGMEHLDLRPRDLDPLTTGARAA